MEAFAVFASTECSQWLVSIANGFDVFKAHNNLIFIFDTLAVVLDLSQAAMRTLIRWYVRMSA